MPFLVFRGVLVILCIVGDTLDFSFSKFRFSNLKSRGLSCDLLKVNYYHVQAVLTFIGPPEKHIVFFLLMLIGCQATEKFKL